MVDYYTTEEGTEREHMEADMQQEPYVDNLTIEYEGIFSYTELLKLINEWAREKKYYKETIDSKEKVAKTGKDISFAFQMQRRISHLERSQIDLSVSVKGMTDVEQELDGEMKNLNKGKVTAVVSGYLARSLSGRWEQKGYAAFIKGVINKFIYKFERPSRVGIVVNESKDIAFKIRGFLNSYPKRLPEQNIQEATIKEGKKPELEKVQELP